MQLKKKLSVARLAITGAAVTAAMLVTSTPAFAADRREAPPVEISLAGAPSTASCRTNADHARREALKLAQGERDNEMRVAREAFLTALQTGRDRYRADLAASASGATLAARLQARGDARARYGNAVKAAESAYADAKRNATSDYRNAVQNATDEYHRARLDCRVNLKTPA